MRVNISNPAKPSTMKAKLLTLAIILGAVSAAQAATGIWGGYLTVFDGSTLTKYKSIGSYPGPESTFNGSDLGSYNTSATLNLTQIETLTFQNSEHSTFDFAFAYRIRLASDSVSTNPLAYTFLLATNGGSDDGVPIGGGNEKGEWTGTVNLLAGLTPGNYALDIIHKAGAWEGGSNFERLASQSNYNPGSTSWASTNPFSATFTVIPEPSTALLGGLGMIALLRRRRQG